MQDRRRWLRSSLVALVGVTGVVCAALAACADAEPDDGELASTDAGDGGAPEAANDARTPSNSNASRLTFVNAAHDLGPGGGFGTPGIRLCFKLGSLEENLSVAPLPPLPDRPQADYPDSPAGIAQGTGVTLPLVDLDLASRIVVPILVDTRSLRGLEKTDASAYPVTCDELVGDAPDASVRLQPNVHYWELPPIEPGTLANGKAYLVALTGCAGNAETPNPGKCGVGFMHNAGSPGLPGLGNLKLTIYETTQNPVAPFGAQFLYLSTQANAFFSQANAKTFIQPGFFSDDGGAFRPLVDVSPAIATLSPTIAVQNVRPSDSFVFGPKSVSAVEADAGVPLLRNSLAAIQVYSGLSADAGTGGGTVYVDGQNYVFIAVGDPDTNETKPFVRPDGIPGGDGGDGSRFNPRSFHFLAYPANPVVGP